MTTHMKHMSEVLLAVVEGRHLDPYPLPQSAIAAISGLPKQTVNRVVRGATGTSLETAIRIALATGVSLDEMAGLEKCEHCGRMKRLAEVHCGDEEAA